MGDTQYPYPVTLQWKEDPEKLKTLKNELLLYFQERSKSNGGECEIRDTDCSRGFILIHFKEERDRDGVLQKDSHELILSGGKKMNLDVQSVGVDSEWSPLVGSQSIQAEKKNSGDKDTPDDEVTLAPLSSLVLIENVQDSCTPELLNRLVKNISEKIEDTDFYVEIIPEIQSAVVTFTCDIDLLKFINTFSIELGAGHTKLTARPLEESRSVRVENVPENTSEAHLRAFFEDPEQGGERVEDIVMVPEERAAVIKFYDTRDVKRVLKKDHVFSKEKISVYPYYPLLGIALYGKDGPCIEIPKPIEFNISPYKLQHICSNEELKNNIDVKMKNKHCEIKWPDKDCQDPVLQLIFSPTLSTHLRSVKKIVPRWKEEVSNEFSHFVSKFTEIEYKMDESDWEAIKEHVSSSTYEGVLIKPDFGGEKVFLVGLSNDVTEIDPTFRQLIEQTTKQVERKTQTKTETISMSPALYQIMCNSGLKKKILDQVPELTIDYDVPTKKARLSGLRDEVLAAKNEILNITQQMENKPIQMNPHLIKFLKLPDNEDLSSLLFVRHNINAMLEIDDGDVKLMAYSKEDLTVAENLIKVKLLHRQILVNDKNLLKSPEWRSLHSHLLQVFNAEKITVLIEKSSSGTEDNMVIAGLTSNVLKCYQQISEFLEDTTIETEIPVKTAVKMTFLWEERKEVLEKIKKNVNVTKNQNSICLSGPRVKVQEAANTIKDILQSLHSDTLRIEKPGAKKFCKANEEVHATTARTNYHCVIRLEEAGVENDPFGKSRYQVTLPNGMILSVYKDNMCRHKVDVIVNAANEQLKHGGGLAKAILDAAGRKLQDDCDQIIRKYGKLSTGESVITDAGNLPCNRIIHTVGPRWKSHSPPKCAQLLQKAITTSLQLASEKSLSSIAIPAVSSGIFGFPIKLCAENIVEAIWDYVETPGQQSTLQRIHLVDMKEETVKAFSEVAKAKFGNQMGAVPSTAMAPQPVTRVTQNPPAPVNRGNDNTVRTEEGLKTKLLQKNIEDSSASTSQPAVNTVAAINWATNIQSAGTGSKYFTSPKAPKPAQKLTAFQFVDGIEPVVFSLCAEDKSNVDKTKAWLQQLIDNEQGEKVITEECISVLEEADVQKISDLQKKFQVSVIYKPPDPSIRIVGLTRDVLSMSGEIETIINRVKDRRNREWAAELTGNLVEWRYGNGGTRIPFDKMTNLELEEAKNEDKAQINIQIRGSQYTVSLKREKAIDNYGKEIQIQRVVKHDGKSHKLPSHWKPMDKTLVMEVDVAQGTDEYSTVQQKFQRTCSNQILKILRVQNRNLWLNYQIKKQNIDSKNSSTTNEKDLFHGTDFASIKHVNQYGFHRSYAGRNAAAHGNRTYFAVDANNTFPKPDVDGQRHMYLARVLTGLYCAGHQGMETPPAKNTANPTNLYDSVTDDVQNPSMFLIFNDIQAYPEYHIIFQ
ncbi:protein mono-ADP-ribosyltransferase PARP14-like [Aquarana catesbeiana]|uniref:protein mono-ADP-ribosyltransferase PARP14-like n=1 Tax=Aquarana catesbeiana TaxID=8400 RepID=UPI003CCA203C